jgi:predicted acetyltransferase
MIEIRPADDILAFLQPCAIAFGAYVPTLNNSDLDNLIVKDRSFAAYENGRIVGSLGAMARELTVEKSVITAACLNNGGVLPSHHRRGIFTKLMYSQLRDIFRRGEAAAILWTSDERIYRRYGFGLASIGLSFEIPKTRASFRENAESQNNVRLLSMEDSLKTLPLIYEKFRRTRTGMLSRSESWWRAAIDIISYKGGHVTPSFSAVFEENAYARYRIHLTSGPSGPESAQLEVIEAIADSFAATNEIWKYLFSIDFIDSIKAYHLPLDHPLLLMLAEPRRLQLQARDNLWLRIVNVAKALEARARKKGSIIIEISDKIITENAGRWCLTQDKVIRTNNKPNLSLDIADLGSVYLGGFTFTELADAGMLQELSVGAAEQCDEIFSCRRKPWTPEFF